MRGDENTHGKGDWVNITPFAKQSRKRSGTRVTTTTFLSKEGYKELNLGYQVNIVFCSKHNQEEKERSEDPGLGGDLILCPPE